MSACRIRRAGPARFARRAWEPCDAWAAMAAAPGLPSPPTSPDGVLVLFPEGEVRWNLEDQSLTIGVERFRLGDEISLTGGASSIGNYAGRINVPRQCVRSGGFFAGAKAILLK